MADRQQCQGDPACKQHVLLPACRPLPPLPPPPPMHPLERAAASRDAVASAHAIHVSNIVSKHKLVGGLVKVGCCTLRVATAHPAFHHLNQSRQLNRCMALQAGLEASGR